jgi:hypothetical protein
MRRTAIPRFTDILRKRGECLQLPTQIGYMHVLIPPAKGGRATSSPKFFPSSKDSDGELAVAGSSILSGDQAIKEEILNHIMDIVITTASPDARWCMWCSRIR